MSDSITVQHVNGHQFSIAIRGHTITVDQPTEAGGTDTAPTPTELFVASLASCVAFYAGSYLARHQISTEGLSVRADFDMGGRPNRVTDVRVIISPPRGLPAERREAFLAVASHCTVHNTLADPATVEIQLAQSSAP